ncbi:MAG: hypothetical protein H0U23_04180 [Blastocatellia bacterium]|nr:hypothetical protein [Blastocatellia bacterium]
MATLRRKTNGEYYIVKGYPISRGGQETDAFFTTIKVLPRAEQFFDAVGYRDGHQIPPEVFYALLVDGDISTPSLERDPPTVADIPSATVYLAEGLLDRHDLLGLLRDPAFVACR